MKTSFYFILFFLFTFSVHAQSLVFNEIFYLVPSYQFIEFYNTGNAIDVAQWTFSDDQGTYPLTFQGTSTVPNGGYFVITNNLSQLSGAPYLPSSVIVASASFDLNATGATLTLIENTSTIIDSVNYGANGFPNLAITGQSIELINPALNRLLGSSWLATITHFGTPGSQNSVFNGMPIANAGVDQTVLLGTTVFLSGSATDPENGLLTYTWSGSNISELNATTGSTVQFTPATVGVRIFTLTASDGVTASSDSVSITVNPPTTAQQKVLVIEDVNVNPISVIPGETFEVEIELKNKADFDLDNVELFIEILDEDNDVVEDDNGNELEDDSEFTLDAGDDETDLDQDDYTFTFRAPFDFTDNEKLTIHVFIQGDRTNNASQHFEDEDSSQTLRIKKKDHDITFTSKTLNPSSLLCDQDTTLAVELRNVGDRDEDVELHVRNDILGITKDYKFEMDNDPDDDTNQVRQTLPIVIPTGTRAGSYPITLEAEFDDGNKRKTETINLIVQECKPSTISTTIPVNQPQEPVVVQTYGTSTVIEPELIIPKPVISTRQLVSIILSLIFIGLFIFIIGAIIIASRKSA